MDRHIHDFYRVSSDDMPRGHYHSVISLVKEPNRKWEELHRKCPNLCKGWYELAHLPVEDRIEFIKEFWHSKLTFHPGIEAFLDKFFLKIDDISVYLVQPKYDDPFEAHLVYSLKEGNGFFRGCCPALESDLDALKQAFPTIVFPEDYLGFLHIHNGFSKTTDTGIMKAGEVKEQYERLQEMIASQEGVLRCGDHIVDPLDLIPFYRSFGMPFFQCFYLEWSPRSEMGNVYYSSATNSISDLTCTTSSVDNLAFSTFARWLMFYLEEISD